MAVTNDSSDAHLLEIAIKTVLHKNKEMLTQLTLDSHQDTLLLNKLAHEITLKANMFEQITNRVVKDLQSTASY